VSDEGTDVVLVATTAQNMKKMMLLTLFYWLCGVLKGQSESGVAGSGRQRAIMV